MINTGIAMPKKNRQSKIKEIIISKKISSQEDLLEQLKDLGFSTTQATLSRDLHEIGIVRVHRLKIKETYQTLINPGRCYSTTLFMYFAIKSHTLLYFPIPI